MTVPALRTRPKLNFDGTVFNGNIYVDASITAANIGADFQSISTDVNFGMTRVANTFVRQFREYRYLKMVMHWVPKVAPGVADGGSQIVLAYTDNPEQCQFLQVTATNAQRRNFAIGSRNNVSFNAWERYTWNVPLTRRLPWFNVNTAEAAYDVNVMERAVQGMVVQGYSSVSAAVILGTMRIEFWAELRGFDSDANAIV